MLPNFFSNKYPYTDFHELNLDWIINQFKEMSIQLEKFVSLNTIKYADPIQWDITHQYETNTIVIDPLTGTAYISIQPVPSGVAITNTDYWTVVFDLGTFVTKASKNFTSNYEEATTLTATFSTIAGDWLIWGDELYKTLVNITAGDQYVVGSNIERFTMESIIGHLDDLSTTNKTSIVNAINEVLTAVSNAYTDLNSKIGSLNDLSTTDKTNIVNAINEVLTAVSNAYSDLNSKIGSLNDLSTTNKTSIVNAINEVLTAVSNAYTDLNSKIGSLDDLSTTDKTSVVNAINSLTDKYIPNLNNRYFLFVGDSYGDEPGEWADGVITLLGLGDRGINLSVNGAGFVSDGASEHLFITQIQNYNGDRNKITDIVICGGLNDSVSDQPGSYANVRDAMNTFNTYVTDNYPNAKVSIGYIGNGNDFAPTSLISGRTYSARQCCRYTYYNQASYLKWNILHNVEYCLTGSPANISSDGVHPSIYGTNELISAISAAIVDGTADFNYPDFTISFGDLIGNLSGYAQFNIHNDVTHIRFNSFTINTGTGVTLTSGTALRLGTNYSMAFNRDVRIPVCVLLVNYDRNNTPEATIFAKGSIIHYQDQLLLNIEEATNGSADVFTSTANSSISIIDVDYSFNSMVLV